MSIKSLKSLYKTHKEQLLFGRYIHTKNIEPILEKLPPIFSVETIGNSVNRESIYSVTIGNGSKKILMWSQMHGNESTTTKALFDVFNILNDSNVFSEVILNNCTLMVIPILNPDGAVAYTRFNANNVDLNRDAQNLSQPESMILRQCFNTFKPDFCFNLHGQRTIFSAGKTNNPATVSFLAPAQDKACSMTENRKIAMEVIVEINKMLQNIIPNQVGIYDDAFNINCVGDTFQSLNVPTILFEAGHFKTDYKRIESRKLIALSLLTSLSYISQNRITGNNYKPYLKIPQNAICFFDIVIRNASVIHENKKQILDIGFIYEERLAGNDIRFIPVIDKISNLEKHFGHKEIDAENSSVLQVDASNLNEGNEIDFVLINNVKYSLLIEKF